MIAGLILTILGLGMFETAACRIGGEAGQEEYQAFAESHCVCTHDSESQTLQGLLLNSVADCSGGCACVPARTGWQNTLSNRVKEDSRGKDSLAQPDTGHTSAYKAPTRLSAGILTPAREPPNLDSVLRSIRTIVLLT
jgi:hypothetical protein